MTDHQRGDDANNTTNLVLEGFATYGDELHWYCAPDSWQQPRQQTPGSNSREGADGSWKILNAKNQLVIVPPAKKDFWRKTYYDPMILKDDGPMMYAELEFSNTNYYTIETSFTLLAVQQFDQAGIMIRLGPEHWLKTGIEVVDQHPRLSCVVTNEYSDWSTQSWPQTYYSMVDLPSDGTMTTTTKAVQVTCDIRVHCRGTSFVVEAKFPTEDGGDKRKADGQWEFVRIAHMHRNNSSAGDAEGSDNNIRGSAFTGPAPPEGKMWAGVFAACPEDQRGGQATFTNFSIRRGSHFEHNADGNN